MKILIYQYFDKPTNFFSPQTHWDCSHCSISAYARKYNYEYKLIDGGAPLCPNFGVFLPFLEGWADDWDGLFYVDSDFLATSTAADIKYFIDHKDICISHMNTGPLVIPAVNTDVSPWYEDGPVNTGAVFIPKSQYENITEYLSDLDHLWSLNKYNPKSKNYKSKNNTFGGADQQILNQYSIDRGQKFFNLHYNFNYHMHRYDRKYKKEASLIHYHQSTGNAELLKNDFKEDFILK